MKNTNLKSIIGMLLMSLLFVAFAPNDASAQRNNDRINNRNNNQNNNRNKRTKEKVVSPVKHYSTQPRRGAQVATLPQRANVVRHRNVDYHYRDGIFYRHLNNRYVVSTPPIGIRLAVLPPNPVRLRIGGHPYFYYYGTYYSPLQAGGYEVVSAPVGAVVDALPDGYDVVQLDGRTYYRLDETYYKTIVERNGNVAYEVVRI